TAEHRSLLRWKGQAFTDRDVHFYIVLSRQRPGVFEIEGVCVGVLVPVFAVKCECDAGFVFESVVDLLEFMKDIVERKGPTRPAPPAGSGIPNIRALIRRFHLPTPVYSYYPFNDLACHRLRFCTVFCRVLFLSFSCDPRRSPQHDTNRNL